MAGTEVGIFVAAGSYTAPMTDPSFINLKNESQIHPRSSDLGVQLYLGAQHCPVALAADPGRFRFEFPLMHGSDEGRGGYNRAHLFVDDQNLKLLLIKKKKSPIVVVV